MLLGITLCTTAQEGLQINEAFEGKVIDKQCMQESLVKGENLKPYKLEMLHTVKFAAGSKDREKLNALFTKDMEERISDDDSNMEYESRDGSFGKRNLHAIKNVIQKTLNIIKKNAGVFV